MDRTHGDRSAWLTAAAGAVAATMVLLLFAPAAEADASAVCPPGEVPPAGFDDVPADSVHSDAIDCVVWYGIAQGTTATTYTPGGEVRRDQMATFLARVLEALGHTLPAAPADHFADDDGNPHEHRINQLAELGVLRGTGAGAYAPAETVRRDQMATFLARTYGYAAGEPLPPGEARFTDVAGNVHEDAINAVAGAGIAAGTTATTYEPAAATRRAQMATFLVRLLAAMEQPPPPPPPAEDDPPAPEPEDEYTLTVQATSMQYGPQPDPGIQVEPSKPAYTEGEQVTVTAPESFESGGYQHDFAFWAIDPEMEHEYDATMLWVTMEDDVTATAFYESTPAGNY